MKSETRRNLDSGFAFESTDMPVIFLLNQFISIKGFIICVMITQWAKYLKVLRFLWFWKSIVMKDVLIGFSILQVMLGDTIKWIWLDVTGSQTRWHAPKWCLKNWGDHKII
jgi:hypothetical protein